MPRLVLTAFGRPARAALETLVAEAKGTDPLVPVTVAVPSSYAGLSLRRHGARFGAGRAPGLVNVRFLALNRVAELLGAPFLAEPDRVPLTPEARLEAARVALAEAPGVFASVAAHPSTVRALVGAFHDLRVADDGALERLASESPRAESVVRCYHRFRELTAGTYDDEDQLEVAARLVADHGIPADLGALVLFCPDHLSPGALALVAGFASRTFTAAVLGLTGDADADAETRRLAGTLSTHLGEPLDSGPTSPRLGDRVISAPDPESEVREVVRALVERADAGRSLHDVAVTWRIAEPHARLLHERLGEAGIQVYGPSVRRLSDTVTGRTLMALIDLMDRDFRRDEVMAFLAGASIRETPGGRPVDVDGWDRLSRRAGIVAGADQWRVRLAQRREEIRTSPREPDPERLEANLERIDRFQHFVEELVEVTTRTFGTWSEWCTWATGLVQRYIGEPPSSWPGAEIDAHHRLLDRLAALGALRSVLSVDRSTFRAALSEQLEQSVDHVGRFGIGVLLCPLSSLTGTDFETIFVVGAAEGRLPPPPRDDPLLPDRERAVTGGQVAPRSIAAARERADYLAALAGASAEVVLSWARSDPVGQRALLPSRWVVETVRKLSDTLITARQLADVRPTELPRVLVLESFAAAVRRPAPAISVGELELKTLDATRGDAHSMSSGPAAHPLTAANPRLQRGFHALSARAEPRFTEFDGVIGARPGLELTPERPLSPSRIEAWAQCPFRYFLANLLGLRKRDAPEAIDTIEARERGSLVHKVLEDFIQEMPRRTSPDQPWSPEERERANEMTMEACDRVQAAGKIGRPLLWQLEQARIVREVSRTLDADERIRAERRLTTLETEVNFGRGADDRLPALTLDLDGTAVTFRGQIDRIDTSEDPDGQVVVYDYKTGSAKSFKGLEDDPVLQGTKIQLAIYALAAEQAFPGRPVRADYWHTAQPAGHELRGFDIATAAPRARDVLSTVAGAVADGTFPAYPGKENPYFNSFEECGFCDFDHLCSPDRERAFDAKRNDPRIESFVSLRDLLEEDALSTAVTPELRVPADQAARDQIRGELDLTLNVVAGAGTGKTHELVKRVVELLREIPLNEIGVITFTTAAASELQERIREQVEQLATTEPDDGPYTRALQALDDAAISTLHAFAQRILAEHPLEASLPPGFEVLDPIQESVAFEDWWQRTLDQLFADETLADSLLVLGALGVKPNRYRQLARVLTEHHDRTAGYGIVPLPVPRLELDPLLEAIDAATSLRSSCTDPSDRMLIHLDTLDELGGRLRAMADDELEALALLGERSKLTCSYGRQSCWRDDGKERAVKACAIANDARTAAIAAVTQPAISNVLGALVREVATASRWRRHEGRVTFHDLLVIARNLFRDDARVRAALADHYRVLLLDEFQDTDPLQIDLAMRIGGTAVGAEMPAAWSDITPRPGALFVVGDPKQSIYRFRRADIELYGQVVDTLTEEVLELTESFRSRPGIIDWVNATLGALMHRDDAGLQVAYSPLHTFRPADPEVPVPVPRLGGAAPKKSILLSDLRVREATELAASARRVQTEGWRVKAEPGEPGAEPLDPSTDEWVRPARFADVAVLVPTRTLLPELEAAFEAADVPLRIESQSLLFATSECRDLVSILGAIDDPNDEIRLVAALRTPAFGCSDTDLFEYHDAGGWWSIFRTPPETHAVDHPVVVGLAELRTLHDRHLWETPADTVERVVRERALFTLALANRRPRDHWRRLRFLTDAAHAFTDAGGASLRGFVAWLDEQREEGARVNESVVAEPDDDAVRVLTVHGSKGLEFPIVFLAGLGVGFRANPAALYHGDPVPELRLTTTTAGTWCTPGYGDRAAHEDVADRAEGMRLLYVATTRARDHLVVSLHHLEGSNCHAAEIERVDAEHRLPWRIEAVDPDPIPAADSVPVQLSWDAESPPAPMDGTALAAWWHARRRAIARNEALPVIAATAIAKALRPEPDPDLSPGADLDALEAEPEDERPAWRRGRGATALGRAVHAVLQTADLATGAGIEGAARAQALAEGIPDREDSIVALARSVLEAPTIRTAAAGQSWREVPVAADIDGVTIEGFIDLLVDDGQDLVVVDYKTDTARTDAELDVALERYRPQGAAYALALERVLGRPVARCVFVFARPKGPAVEREVTDLRALVDDVRGHLRAVAAATVERDRA